MAKHWTQHVRGLPRQPGRMNKSEARYSMTLEDRRRRGEIQWWAFEPLKLRLADTTFYTPDFAVMHADGWIELVEIKGFWADDARVKFKTAAAVYWMFAFTSICGGKVERLNHPAPLATAEES